MVEFKQTNLNPEVESTLGIQFIEPNQGELESLEKSIGTLSQFLGSEAYLPIPPKKGFLSTSLTILQSSQIEAQLGIDYAKDGVDLQDELLTLTVSENNEKMVYVPSLFSGEHIPLSLSELPFHQSCGIWAGKLRTFWLREQVAIRLLSSGKALSEIGLMLHIEDAFRPLQVQEGLFERRAKMILNEHPEWINEPEKIWQEARSKTAISPIMAGHKSGAAVDLTLRKLDGSSLPLGNTYPEGGPKVAMHFPYITQEEWTTRQLFNATMQMSGLQIYPFENWHASFGDLSGGIDTSLGHYTIKKDYQTIYGPIKGFDESTGKIDPYAVEDYNKPFFTIQELIS